MSVQIAIVGIVVVVGLFVLWRRISRLEERVEAVTNMQRIMGGGSNVVPHTNNHNESTMPDDEIMAAIFDLPLDRRESAGIVECETVKEENEEECKGEVAPSESDVGLSKSKLRKLPVDELKNILEGRGQSIEGNKSVLVDRIYGSD